MRPDLGKIAIVGSGSIGLYYGAKLAKSGQNVHFLMRSGYEEAVERGIRILDKTVGDEHLERPHLTESTVELGPVDLVIVATKATANSALPDLISPLVHSQTSILTLQNGLGTEAFLARHFGHERILGGLCFVCLTRVTPASVRHVGRGQLSIGEYERPNSKRLQAITDAFNLAGVNAQAVENLAGERWRKLVWNIPFNGLTIVHDTPVDGILERPQLLEECWALMREAAAIAAAAGHAIPESFLEWQITRTKPMGPYQPSSYIDFLAGNEVEVEPIWGEPLRTAEAFGIPVPHLQKLYDQLRTLCEVRLSLN